MLSEVECSPPQAFISDGNGNVWFRANIAGVSRQGGSTMKRFAVAALVLGVAGLALAGAASAQQAAPPSQYVFPAKGQTPEQQQQDEAECSSWATQQTGFNPSAPPPPPAPQPTPPPQKNAGLKGAARGAAAGYIIGDIANDEGGEGAAIGAVVGGSRSVRKQQQAQASAQQQQAAQQQQYQQQVQALNGEFLKARAACLESKGYTVK